jgi:hypothetical protein
MDLELRLAQTVRLELRNKKSSDDGKDIFLDFSLYETYQGVMGE